MDDDLSIDFKRLEQQLFENLKCNEEVKKGMRKRLHEQLVEKQPVVKVQPIDDECQRLMESLRQRLLFLQEVIKPQKKHKSKDEQRPKFELKDEWFELDLSSDSSDDEVLANIIKQKSLKKAPVAAEASKGEKDVPVVENEIEIQEREDVKAESKIMPKFNENLKDNQMKTDDKKEIETKKVHSSPVEDDVPLALRRPIRERRLSYKSYTSSSSSMKNVSTNTRTVSKKHQQHCQSVNNRRDSVVSTTGAVYHHDEDLLVEEDYETPHTFHIKIPSLFKRSVHNIHLDASEFSRKVIEYRTKLSKQNCRQMQQLEELQPDCLTTTNSKKKRPANKKSEKLTPATSCSRQLDFFQQQQQDEELSQLIQDVINDAVGNDETLQATTALENINNDLNDNYRTFGTIMPLSQSSHEQLCISENSTFKQDATKKRRKTSKNSEDQQANEQPVKKRVRKTKAKSTTASLDASLAQPPTKSNLAKYVEYFANDCEILPNGSTTPAASSTMSQPLVTSTTQNFEFIDNQQQQHHLQQQQQEQQTQPQSITYFFDGDWANGGSCQLVQTTGMTLDAGQINQQAMSSPFQDFVNYIDNNADAGNNVIDRVLDNCTSLPVSIPLPIANMGFQNILQHRQLQQTTQNTSIEQPPIINIQIPPLPTILNNTGPLPPPPAHSHEEVLDLSVKPDKSNFTIISSEVLNLNKNANLEFETLLDINEEDNNLPLDLSVKSSSIDPNSTNSAASFSHEKLSQSQFSIGSNQEDDFIRRLIETSDFDLRPEELAKSTAATYDDGESFKAALDMPILELNDADLVKLVESTTNIGANDESNKLKDNNVSNDINEYVPNNDSNYVSMSESNANVINFGDEINFADQSTKEIFDKLLDIGPDNMSSLDTVAKDINCTYMELDDTTFDRNKVQNSTMCEVENASTQKDQRDADIKKQDKIISSNEIKETISTSTNNKTEVNDKFIPRILKRRKSMFQNNPPNEDKSNVTDGKLKRRKSMFQNYPPNEDKSNVTDGKLKKVETKTDDVKTKENSIESKNLETYKISDGKSKDDSTKSNTNNNQNKINEMIASGENTDSSIGIDPIAAADKQTKVTQIEKLKTQIKQSCSPKENVVKKMELDKHISDLKTSLSNQQDKSIIVENIIISNTTEGISKENEVIVERNRLANEINPIEIKKIKESKEKVNPRDSNQEIITDQILNKENTDKIVQNLRFEKSPNKYIAKPSSEIKKIVVQNKTSTKEIENKKLIIETDQSIKNNADKTELDLRFENDDKSQENEIIVQNKSPEKKVHSIDGIKNKKTNKMKESEQKDKPKESKDEIKADQSIKENVDKTKPDLGLGKNNESKENEIIVENEAKDVNSMNDVKTKKTNKIKKSEQNEKPEESKDNIETDQSITDLKFGKNNESKENEKTAENESSTKEVHSINDVETKKTNEIKESKQKEKPKETQQEIETHQSPKENPSIIKPDQNISIGDEQKTTNAVLEPHDLVSAENNNNENAFVLQSLKVSINESFHKPLLPLSNNSEGSSQNESKAETLAKKLQDCFSAKEDNMTSDSLTDKQYDPTDCVDNSNDSTISEESFNLKVLAKEDNMTSDNLTDKQHDPSDCVDNSNDSTVSEESLHLKVSDTSENSNELNLSDKSIKLDESLNLKTTEDDLKENTNKSIDVTDSIKSNEIILSEENLVHPDELSSLKTTKIDFQKNTIESIDLTGAFENSNKSNKINLSEDSITNPDELLSLKSTELDFKENVNASIDLTSEDSSKINSSEKSIESAESSNLRITEIDLNENLNESINLTVSFEDLNKSNDINFFEEPLKSNESLGLQLNEIDLTQNTNESIDLSVKLNTPENNTTTTDTTTHLNNELSNKQDPTETEAKKLDSLVELIELFEESQYDHLQNPNISLKPSTEASIDQSLNLKLTEDNSLVKISSLDSDLVLNLKKAESRPLEIFSKSNSPQQSIESLQISHTTNETTKILGAEFSSNKKIVFSVAKIALSDDDAPLTDSDTNSGKSLDAAIIRNHPDIKKKDTEKCNYAILTDSDTSSNKSFNPAMLTHQLDATENNSDNISSGMDKSTNQDLDTEIENVPDKTDTHQEDESVVENVQIPHKEEQNVDMSMPKLKILENYANSCYVAEQNDEPLCLTKSIEKKFYPAFSPNDIIDLSMSVRSRDTDADYLLIDESIQQSPMVVNSCFSNNSETSNYSFPENSPVLEICDHRSQDVTEKKDCVNSTILENTTAGTSKVLSSCSSKSNDLTNLTPLELESKLEDTLDFEDFDDALSLATSCFDSPNDDRFEESIVDETESETKATTTNLMKSENEGSHISAITNIASQTTTSASSTTVVLKSFKIPKLNKVSITTPAIADKPTDYLTNFSSIPKITIKQPIVKLEKITRNVNNELAATGSVLVNKVQPLQVRPNLQSSSLSSSVAKQQITIQFTDKSEITASSATTNTQNTRGVSAGLNGEALPLADKIIQIFGVTCQPYLVNQCYAITHCPLKHEINSQDNVFQALSTLNKVELNESYKFMYNHSNLFQIYFLVFCNYYALQKDRTKLLNMINDCERYPEFSEFLFTLYEGLVKCGFSRVNACRQILKRSRQRITPIINVLVAIIMKSDWTMFTDFIDHITDETFQYKFRIGILEQMAPAVLNSKGPELKQLFGKCVQMLHCEDTVLLCNSPSLIQCVALLTST